MANYYTDIPELKYHLNNPMMERICELKERNYRDKEEFDYAPQDYADAMDSFDKVLEITGEITGEIIAPNAEGVDEEGPHCANGRVEYASGTKQNLDAMVKAGLNGMTMPRRFGGLNFPITPYTMCAEIVAAADAGFGNIWSLQDCIETLYEFVVHASRIQIVLLSNYGMKSLCCEKCCHICQRSRIALIISSIKADR